MKQYDNYKNSGVEWLGEIPEHWKVKRLKYIFEILKRISGELGHEVLSITQTGIKIKDIQDRSAFSAKTLLVLPFTSTIS